MKSYFTLIAKDKNSFAVMSDIGNKILSKLSHYRIIISTTHMMVIVKEDGINNNYNILGNGKGVIIGDLFKSISTSKSKIISGGLDRDYSEIIIKNNGRNLFRDLWGAYVAFLMPEGDRPVVALRDPVGGLPAYIYEKDEYYIIFSDSKDFKCIYHDRFSFNIENISSSVFFIYNDYYDTGLNEISKIAPGQAAYFGRKEVNFINYWGPEQFCYSMPRWTVDTAAEALAATIDNVVQARASPYQSVALQLSGGLDSSIVLSSLKMSPNKPEINCINYYYDSGTNCDEREMARVAARHENVNLIEKRDSPEDVNLSLIHDFAFSVEPERARYWMFRGAFERHVANIHNVEAFFSGDGGDHLFYQGSKDCALEYLLLNNFGKDFLKQCFYSSHLEKKSFWDILFNTLHQKLTNNDFKFASILKDMPNSIMNDDIFSSINLDKRFSHWASNLGSLPSAKKRHIFNSRQSVLSRPPNRPCDYVTTIDPLFSQPLIELCYSIPCFLFGTGGVSRGLVRHAFANRLAPDNVWRVSKGGTNDFEMSVFERNIDFLREFFLDGILVKIGVLDKYKLENALKFDFSCGMYAVNAIIENISVEAWARYWSR